MADPWSVSAPGLNVKREAAVRMHVLRLREPDATMLGRIEGALGINLPALPNRTSGIAPRVLALAPGEYLLLGVGAARGAAILDAAAPATAHLADLTAGLVCYRVAGSLARDLIAKGCTIDFHPRVFRPDHCAQTALAQVFVIIDQVAADPVFNVIAEASYAHHLNLWFEDAAIEFTALAVA